MIRKALLDAGPLVAYLNARDRYHEWAVAQWKTIALPLITCDSVLSEACFVLRKIDGAPAAVAELVSRGVLRTDFDLNARADRVAQLLRKYASVPMSFADACLVCMSEALPRSRLLTCDSDFLVYTRSDRRRVPVIFPEPDR